MPPDDPAEGFKHGLDAQGAVEDGEDAFSQGIAQTSDALTSARLSGTDEHHRRGWLHSPKKLQHLLASGTLIAVGLHREFEIDQCDVDLLLLHQSGCIPATSGFQTSHAEGIQQPRQFCRRAALPPGGGKQQIQATGGR